MTEIKRSALLPYPADLIYQLINDVEAYPEYMDECVSAEIYATGQDAQGIDYMEARLDLAKAGFKHSLTTRNRLLPPGRVEMSLVDGPVENFSGLWVVQPLSDSACKVSLALSFSVSSRMLRVAVRVLFDPLADDLVNSLVKRAHHIYQ